MVKNERVRLKHILRPLKERLEKELGVKATHDNVVNGDFVRVSIHLPNYENCLKFIIDMSRLTQGMEQKIEDQLFKFIQWKYENIWGLTANELHFLGQLPSNIGFWKGFEGEISSTAWNLNEIDMVHVETREKDNSWSAAITALGAAEYEKLMKLEL